MADVLIKAGDWIRLKEPHLQPSVTSSILYIKPDEIIKIKCTDCYNNDETPITIFLKNGDLITMTQSEAAKWIDLSASS